MNINVIRKINAKGNCFYKKDYQSLSNINFDKKIIRQVYSPIENYSLLIVYNCIYNSIKIINLIIFTILNQYFFF